MDPLSITAGVIAIVQITTNLSKLACKLYRLKHGPSELLDLSNAANDLRMDLKMIEGEANSWPGDPSSPNMQSLSKQINHWEAQTLQVSHFVETLDKKAQERTLSRKLHYLTNTTKVKTHTQALIGIKHDLGLAILKFQL